MKIPNSIAISHDQALTILAKASAENWKVSYHSSRHQLEFEYSGNRVGKLFLPWQMSWSEGKLSLLEDFHLALTGIRAGQAFVGYFNQGVLEDHRIFRAYMVRKKQGKSQLKYLKTKGKSRAGSRVRLSESIRFFNEINERLQRYSSRFPITRWGISCSKTLLPYFLNAEIPPPFTLKDAGASVLPVHINQASFEELKQCHQVISGFHLIQSGEDKLLPDRLHISPPSEEEADDW